MELLEKKNPEVFAKSGHHRFDDVPHGNQLIIINNNNNDYLLVSIILLLLFYYFIILLIFITGFTGARGNWNDELEGKRAQEAVDLAVKFYQKNSQ